MKPNFNRVFLKTIFFKSAGTITQKVIYRSSWNFAHVFSMILLSIWTYIFPKVSRKNYFIEAKIIENSNYFYKIVSFCEFFFIFFLVNLQNMTLIIIQNFGFYFQINRTEATMSTNREVSLRPSQKNVVYIGDFD